MSRVFQRVRLCGEGGGGHVCQDQLHHHQGAGSGLPCIFRALAATRQQSEPQMATQRPPVHPRHRPKERRGCHPFLVLVFLYVSPMPSFLSIASLYRATDPRVFVLKKTFVVTPGFSNQVLTFKEINWQSLRIEADAIESDDQDLGSTPLRLITNQGRIRIALKRRVRLHLPCCLEWVWTTAALTHVECMNHCLSHFVLSRSRTVTCLRPSSSSSWTTCCGSWQTPSWRPSSIMPNLWVRPWKSRPSSGRAGLLNPFRL